MDGTAMSIDRSELQDSARKIFPASSLIPHADQSWQTIVEMGWPALTVPEEFGGLGLSAASLGTLYSELGRVLAPVPFLPTMLALQAVTQSSELKDREEWIGRLMGGEIVAFPLGAAPVDQDNDGAMHGTLEAVPDADKATHLLLRISDKGLWLFVPMDQKGVSITPREFWDKSRGLFDVTLDGVPIDTALIVAKGEEATRLFQDLHQHLHLALAADSLGGAEALLELTVEYLQTRRQFDRPLAMFQALKHRCADLKCMLSAAQALFESWVEDESVERAERLVRAAALKGHAASVYHAIAEEAIQLHGGIGVTAEHHCHLFLKRALLNECLGGTDDEIAAAFGAHVMREAGAAARS